MLLASPYTFILASIPIKGGTQNFIAFFLHVMAGNCPICFESLERDVCVTNPCGHLFHRECFDEWASRGSSTTTLEDYYDDPNCLKIKCPTCNARTNGYIKVFMDLTKDNGNGRRSEDVDVIDISGDNDSSRSEVASLKQAITSLKDTLRKKNETEWNMKEELRAVDKIKSERKDFHLRLVEERKAHAETKRKMKACEEGCNNRIARLTKTWETRHLGMEKKLNESSESVRHLKTLRSDFDNLLKSARTFRNDLAVKDEVIRRNKVKITQMNKELDENKRVAAKAKQDLVRIQLNDCSSSAIRQLSVENKKLKQQLDEYMTKPEACYIEERRKRTKHGTIASGLLRDKKRSKVQKNPFSAMGNISLPSRSKVTPHTVLKSTESSNFSFTTTKGARAGMSISGDGPFGFSLKTKRQSKLKTVPNQNL